MSKITLSSVSTKDIYLKDKNLTFTIRALTRDEYYDITQRYAALEDVEDPKERIAIQRELEDEILNMCIESDEVREIVKHSSYNVVNTIIDEIFRLSGLGGTERKNLR